MKTEKKCKGQNKAKGFDGCGELTDVRFRKYGLCPKCMWHWMQSTPEGKTHYSDQFLAKVEHNKRKVSKAKDKALREELKSVTAVINEVRKVFQKYIRARDINDACISCGDTKAKMWHAGHFFKAELYTGLIFDEANCNKQCEKCNTFLNGNESNYRIGIVEKYGEAKVKMLEEIKDECRLYKFTKRELREIEKMYKKKYKNIF